MKQNYRNKADVLNKCKNLGGRMKERECGDFNVSESVTAEVRGGVSHNTDP